MNVESLYEQMVKRPTRRICPECEGTIDPLFEDRGTCDCWDEEE